MKLLCGGDECSSRKRYVLSVILLFFLCVLAAFAMRTHNYNREAERLAQILPSGGRRTLSFLQKFLPYSHRNFMPYTIECAMMFYYTQEIAAGRKIPDRANELHGLEDLAPYRQMIMGLEWFLGGSWRIKKALFGARIPTEEELRFQDNPDLAGFVPVLLRAWMSLSSGFLFLLLLTLGCGRKEAFFGGMFHAVAISAIARSTGQDLIRGNFAMPFIAAAILLLFSVYRKEKVWKYLLLFLCSFCALAFWDLSLGLFSFFALFELARYVLIGEVKPSRLKAWIFLACAAVLNALFVPFNQTYLMIMSPLVTVLLPAVTLTLFLALKFPLSAGKRLLFVLLLLGALYGFWHTAIRNEEYLSAYSHFSELTRAKFRFGNVKPRDPALLSYDARILWTPAMHSADWKTLRTMFPAISLFTGSKSFKGGMKVFSELLNIPVAAGGFLFLLLLMPLFSTSARRLTRRLPKVLFFHSFTFLFLGAFVYIVRYHEFAVLFLAVSLPLLLRDCAIVLRIKKRTQERNGNRRRAFLYGFLSKLPAVFAVFVLILETSVSLLGNRVYSSDVHLRQTAALIQWFRKEDVKGKCVITDFTVGPMLLCYAKCAIALQPQFGLERIRKPTEKYLKILYHGTEKDLAKFCNSLKADFFIHNAGYLGEPHIYSERYIADAVKLKADSPVVLMRYMPERLRYFCRIEVPRKEGYPSPGSLSSIYTVFKVIRPEDRIQSMRLAFAGERFLRENKRAEAEACAKKAFLLDPLSRPAKTLCLKLFRNVPHLTLSGAEF
ncbi:MAG: hypothetical protein J6A21_11125 [Lentisphaeria bacterium]|nr:hypothetical protein [Lentisphaeria bacterium]